MIEKHVVNFELSKRLHELGVNKGKLCNSIFSWESCKDGSTQLVMSEWLSTALNSLHQTPAYTASELLEMIPFDIKNDGNFDIGKDEGKYEARYMFDDGIYPILCDENLSNALAKMLIYLIENKIVSVENINEA
jgi:hypothetical protein